MMTRESQTLETLDRKVAELASFLTPAEIFRALLEGTVVGAPRASVFLAREGRFKGWNSIGYEPAAALAQRKTMAPADSGWLASLAEEEDVRWRSLMADETPPNFGQPHAGEAVGLPLRVGGKAVAILVAERHPGEGPWSPPALSLLCQAARLRLELDLAWRRLKAHAAGVTIDAPPPGPTPAAPHRVATPATASASAPAPAPAAAVAATADSSLSELTPWSGATAAAGVNPRHEEARRYARLVATDIRLYNEEAVIVGRRQRDLAQRLGDQLQRGREAFSNRFPGLGPEELKLLDDAYVQVLAGGDPTLI